MPKLNFVKKISLIILSSLLFLNSMAMPFAVAHAADDAPSTWYNQGFTDWYAKVYGDESPPSEIFGERYTAAQVQWILYSLFSFPGTLLGPRVQKIQSCLLSNIGTPIASLSCYGEIVAIFTDFFSALGMTFLSDASLRPDTPNNLNAISSIFDYKNRPLSGIGYFVNLTSKFIHIPEANAQGFGYGEIKGLQDYWSGFRNMAYALSVLVIVIFAFMIMFRVKLSPQIVISVQSALPKIIGALILATFSYAIAGFVIDLSYVVGGLFATLMDLAGFQDFQIAFNTILPISPKAQLFSPFYIFGFMAYYTVVFFIAAVMAFAASFASVFTSGSFLSTILSFILIIFTIWVLVLMLWYTLKVPWVLLKNLISLFVSIVIAPIQIIIGALVPSIGFGMWFKKIVAETMVFPLAGLFMFLAVEALSASIKTSWSLGTGGRAPQLWSPPILGNGDSLGGVIWLVMSFVFVSMIPKAVDIMKMLIMNGKFDFGSAIGETVVPAVGLGKAAIAGRLSILEDERRKRGKEDLAPITQIARSLGLYK